MNLKVASESELLVSQQSKLQQQQTLLTVDCSQGINSWIILT